MTGIVDRSLVGTSSRPREVAVEAGRLRLFALATGETDPVHTDEAAARRAGHPGLLAPPTFVFSLAMMAPDANIDISAIAPEPARVLHGEQSFVYQASIHAGDRITLVTTVSAVEAKKDGTVELVTFDTEAVNQKGVLCVTARTVAVVPRPLS